MTDQPYDTPREDFSDATVAAPAPEPFPWPPSESESVLGAWGRTWHGAALRPAPFFAALPHDGSLGAAILYYLSIGVPVAGAQLFWRMAGLTGASAGAASTALGASEAWSPLIDFLAAPLTLLLSLFLAAGVTHLMLKLFGAGDGGAGVTVRVFAFAYSPQLLGVVPIAGTIVGFIWMVVVAIIGLRAAHRTTTVRATAAVLIPLAIGLFIAIVVILLARAGELLQLPV